MAEGLRGPHWDLLCSDCGRRFCCAADQRPAPYAVCPNCGSRDNPWPSGSPLRGDRVLVFRSAYLRRAPQRWEVVAFRHPEHARQIVVKRVVGLPGENVQIREGEVYVDGRIARKSLVEQRAVAVPVYDSRYSPHATPGLPPRWTSPATSTGWQLSPRVFQHPDATSATLDWCEYRHWRRTGETPERAQEAPLDDACGYNQGAVRRSHPVEALGDLLLSFRLAQTQGTGRLLVRAGDGRREFAWSLDFGARRFAVSCDGHDLPEQSGALPDPRRDALVEVSLFDRQFLAAIDGRVLTTVAFPDDAIARGTARPFALGVQGLAVVVREVRIARDVYYTHPIGLDARRALDAPYHLGPDEYFVLGDNSPVSDDCRSWPHAPALPARLLYGRPLLVTGPSCVWGVRGWRAHLPDPHQMRYIR